MPNPFEPTFGRTPPLLVGRDTAIAEVAESIERVGGTALATLVTGARGSGKTVLLNAFEDAAKDRGWIVFSDAATPGLINRLVSDRLIPLLEQLDGNRPVELWSGPIPVGDQCVAGESVVQAEP